MADGGFDEMPNVSIAPLFSLACLFGGGVGSFAMSAVLGLFVMLAQKLHHFYFTCRYRNSRYPRRRYPLTLN